MIIYPNNKKFVSYFDNFLLHENVEFASGINKTCIGIHIRQYSDLVPGEKSVLN